MDQRPSLSIFIALIALVALPFSQMQAAESRTPFPILAWWSIPPDQATPERYRELSEAGFTVSLTRSPNLAGVQKALDAARGTHVTIFAWCPELDFDSGGDPAQAVAALKGHPALAGYHVRDEPDAGMFPRIAEWMKRLKSLDPDHEAYVNLFPIYASPQQLGSANYRDYVSGFLRAVPVRFLSFDHYPVGAGGRFDHGVYENLEIAAASAREAGIPLWTFARLTSWADKPVPTLAHLRLQAYSGLAYGAQCLQYFTYWTPPPNPGEDFHDAPISSDGKRTQTYEIVKSMNRELQDRWAGFAGFRVDCVAHCGPHLPTAAVAYRPIPPVAAIDAGSSDIIVSHLSRGREHRLLVVNRDVDKPCTLSVSFAAGANTSVLHEDGSTTPASASPTVTITPGGAAMWSW
ncbi:MAG: hypothetical protein H0V44_12855 [Planctomycetes bacterium]|nr:hypothetical protein [Planctomycetota bacterium]